jgi:transcriptional regulator with XRE-family HTH domain
MAGKTRSSTPQSQPNLGNDIKAYRARHGLSQNEFGKRVGLRGKRPQGTVFGWEHGIPPRGQYRVEITRLLEADISSLEQQSNNSAHNVDWHKNQIARLYNVAAEKVTIEIRW